MGLFVSTRKLKAAAGSMHQFCPVVRSIFVPTVPDEVVEAATVFLYEHMAREVFGGRFAVQMRERIRCRYRTAPPQEIESRLDRIGRNVTRLREHAEEAVPTSTDRAAFTQHVRCVIRALLIEAGCAHDDAELIRATFSRFEDAARSIKTHLVGIQRQSAYVMR